MKRTKRTLIAILCLMLSSMLLLTACTGEPQTELDATASNSPATQPDETPAESTPNTPSDSQLKDTIVGVLKTDVGTLNPFDLNNANMKRMAGPILEPLVLYGEDGELECILAESYEFNEDCTAITIKLKEGVLFHNGEELTADDVIYTFQGYAAGNTKSDVSAIDTANIEAIDKYTVRFPSSTGTSNSTMLEYIKNIQIVNKKYMEDPTTDKTTWMVGTGPYVLTEYKAGDHLSYTAFENYHGGKAKTQNMVLRFIAETSVAMIELGQGNVDIIFDALTTDIERVTNGEVSGLKTISGPNTALYMMVFNNANEPLNNLKVRQAIAHAINKEDIRIAAFNDYSVVAHSPIPVGSFGFDQKWLEQNPYEYNLDTAKALLAEAGYADGFEVRLVHDGSASFTEIADMLIYQLNQINITVNLIQYDTATVTDILKGNDWDITLKSMTSNGEAMVGLTMYGDYTNAGEGGSVITHIANDPNAPGYLDLLNKCMATGEREERKAVYAEIQDYFNENIWYLPLVCKSTVILAKDSLEGAYVMGSLVYVNDAYIPQ